MRRCFYDLAGLSFFVGRRRGGSFRLRHDEGGVEVVGSPTVTGTASPTGTAPRLTVNPNAKVINVGLSEWAVRPSETTAKAGPLTFSTRNAGTMEHELVVIKTDRDVNNLPMKEGKVDEDAAGREIGEIDRFNPGLTQSATFELSPGKYALICNIPGHYQAGMRAQLTVQ
ncbi:MAG TPA: plastocyanin/azurin family copper-binding protein [Dehalococcoidia bacterium]|nr:plastocyanin/azurin family copper-binding protein [Dehalococcoidia bacterium]